MDKLHFLPFFRLHSEALKMMLGVEDNRSVLSWLREKGIPIHGTGRYAIVLTQEIVEVLAEDDKKNISYKAKNKLSEI